MLFLNSESLTIGLHIVTCIFRLDPVWLQIEIKDANKKKS